MEYICDKCKKKTNTLYAMDGLGKLWYCAKDWEEYEEPQRIRDIKESEHELSNWKKAELYKSRHGDN